MLNSKERFLRTLHLQAVDRPPVWLMRQAGRHLPEYRKLKEKYSFLELAQNPELATEVTLQPLRRYPMDAAILFSDILVIPEAMGQPYHFLEKGGIAMEYTLDNERDIEKLVASGCSERLDYVRQTLEILKKELNNEKALLGFCGSPWTLACYMIEGSHVKGFPKTKSLFYSDRDLFDLLLEKISDALVDYLTMQVKAGVDAVQIFDSWAGLCPANAYVEMSLQWISRVIKRLPPEANVIVYTKGMSHLWSLAARAGAKAVSVDWTVDLPHIASHKPGIALQGNIDPLLMVQEPDVVESEVKALLNQMRGINGFIFNLGHGLTPDARPESVLRLAETVNAFNNEC